MMITYHDTVVFDISRQTFDAAYCAIGFVVIAFCSWLIVREMRRL